MTINNDFLKGGKIMKKVKWLVSVLVVASIALGIIGCSSPSGPSGSGNVGTQQGGANGDNPGEQTGGNPGEQPEVHEHTFAEEWKTDENFHWKECECGAKKDFEEHTVTWNVTTEPKTNTEGRNERTCSNCGYAADSVVLQPAPEGFRFVKGATVTGATVTGALPAWLNESAHDSSKGVFIEGRTVTVSDFYMGKYEVTQEEYASVMAGQKVTVDGVEYTLESNPNYCTADSTSYTLFNGDVQEKRPVEGVTWYDAVWYCNALSEKEGLTKAYNIKVTQVEQVSGKTEYYISSATVSSVENATGYRLPTEAEWEYAARGGDPTAADWNYVFSGADTAEDVSYESDKNAGLDSVGWYCYNNITGITGNLDVSNFVSGRGTHQVGKKAPNRLGLYDMCGNLWEWCYDWYGYITTTTPADGVTRGSNRVLRGGSWYNTVVEASVCNHCYDNPDRRYESLGFRVVRQAN